MKSNVKFRITFSALTDLPDKYVDTLSDAMKYAELGDSCEENIIRVDKVDAETLEFIECIWTDEDGFC